MRGSRFVIAALLLTAALLGQRRLDAIYAEAAKQSEASRREFKDFPQILGRWRGTRVELTARQVELLAVDDYLRMDFSAPDGGDISVYAGYYRNGDLATRHPPTICYPGTGWLETYQGRATYRAAGEEPLSVQETVFEQGQRKTLVVYWYNMAGYSGSDASWQKMIRLKRLLMGKGVAGVLKVQMALEVEASREDAEERLGRFLADFLPEVERFIPKDHSEGN